MNIIRIQGRLNASRILIGERFENIRRYIDPGKTIIVSDRNVHRRHEAEYPPWPLILLEAGEGHKTLATVERIYRQLLDLRADRSSFILAVGGGVTCDIAGFAASTFMRGLRYGFVASSLLGQADACVGGKNGVNVDGYKNIVGAFSQPEFVLCDPHLLQTLPKREIANGYAEVIKHGFIGNPRLVTTLEQRSAEALALEPELVAGLVRDSLRVKAAIVRRDERESGPRRYLNFGHTLGHALEKTQGLSHGQAVALGMVFAVRLSMKKGLLQGSLVLERLVRLLGLFGLPAAFEAAPLSAWEAMAKDKKKSGDLIDFVLLKGMGRPVLERIPLSALKEDIRDLCQPPRA